MSTTAPSQSSSHRTLSLSHRHSHRSTSTAGSSTTSVAGSRGKSRRKSFCRQDQRLGVSTDYPDLALHSAAANGNIGLVQYALSHGQPVNSVLNGVLPLHAAASSGNETVVRTLIEAGADVNSPRLPRRYTNERSKSSSLSVGTTGSTPLHFAAANGHTSIIHLLLSYGADPRIAEKHRVTPEAIALQNGHAEAAAALRAWVPPVYDTEGEDYDDVASLLSTKSSLRNLSLAKGKKRLSSHLHPQRSFDALATKLHHNAAALGSSTSLHSLASLASSAAGGGSPNPSSSQISLGAILPPATFSAPSSPNSAQIGRRVSLPSTASASHRRGGGGKKDGSSSTATARRPSLPSVWEKAAHPRAALKQALGMNSISGDGGKGGRGDPDSSRAPSTAAGSSRGSLSSTLWERGSVIDGQLAEEEEEEGVAEDGVERDQQEGAELAERRRSFEVHRPLRQNSFRRDEPPPPPPLPTSSKTGQPLAPIPALARAASQHQFYRPRQSSQLSTQSFSGRRGSLEDPTSSVDTPSPVPPNGPVFEDDSPPPSAGLTPKHPSPARPRAVSNPNPANTGSRSPLLQKVQFNQQQQQFFHQAAAAAAAGRSREPSATSVSTASTAAGGEPSSRPSTAGHLADSEFSEGSGASRTRPAPAGDVRRTWILSPQPPAPTSASSVPSTAGARLRSNSASTDGAISTTSTFARFSSSPGSSYSGPTFSSYSHASTALTSVAPDSPGAKAMVAGAKASGRGLTPLYEGAAIAAALSGGGTGDDEEGPITSRAQARRRVQKAEKELLQFDPKAAASTSSLAAGSVRSAASARSTGSSLKDQLAAYGRTLRVEKELAEREEREEREEKERGEKGAYTYETIVRGKTPTVTPAPTAAPTLNLPPTSTSGLLPYAPPSSTSSATARRAHPLADRLAPPPLLQARTKRTASPASAFTPRRPESIVSKTAAGTPPKEASSHAVSEARPGSPTSTRSGKSSSAGTPKAVPPLPTSTPITAPILGSGPGGISFVGVAPSSHLHHPHHHHHHHHHIHPGRPSRSDKGSLSDKGAGGSSITSGGGNGKLTTRDQVEEDRRRREEDAAKVPRAERMTGGPILDGVGGGKKKAGGLKRFFGGK
ncbi:hypothetical protein JCM11251_003370 [Rhodosporidiobolus azoricus]